MSANAPNPSKFEIFIDQQKFTVEQTSMSGAQLKALAGKPSEYQVFEELPGNQDKLISDTDSVAMKNGQHFFTVPPATFG